MFPCLVFFMDVRNLHSLLIEDKQQKFVFTGSLVLYIIMIKVGKKRAKFSYTILYKQCRS
jgi:hypothetical protein